MDSNNISESKTIDNIQQVNPSEHQSNKIFPVYLLLVVFFLFIALISFLFYKYQYQNNISRRSDNNFKYEVPTAPQMRNESITPTPATQEEAELNEIRIDDNASDFNAIDSAAQGL